MPRLILAILAKIRIHKCEKNLHHRRQVLSPSYLRSTHVEADFRQDLLPSLVGKHVLKAIRVTSDGLFGL